MYLYKSLAKHNIILKKTIEQRKIDSRTNTQICITFMLLGSWYSNWQNQFKVHQFGCILHLRNQNHKLHINIHSYYSLTNTFSRVSKGKIFCFSIFIHFTKKHKIRSKFYFKNQDISIFKSLTEAITIRKCFHIHVVTSNSNTHST